LSTTYKVITGDTFGIIARKKYGTETEAGRIASANPGVVEPLSPGTSIIIPQQTNAPTDAPQQAPADNEDEVSISIDGLRFRFWDSVRITRAIDSIDVIEFGAPFDASDANFRSTFRPFSYKDLTATVGGERLFTGTQVVISPILENDRKPLEVGGYATPGVLNDCTMPASSFPLEFNGQTLQEIATTLAAPFGVSVEFRAEPGATFERVAIDPGKKILPFLAKLAKQRNLVISNTPSGALLFWRSVNAGQPVARLSQGSSPLVSVTPQFRPQKYFSHITGLEPTVLGLKGSQFTVKNTLLAGAVRPFSFNTPDTLDADIPAAVRAKVGHMFGNMATYAVEVDTWRDPSGKLWEPNTTLTLVAPDAMVYNEFEFEIRAVSYSKRPASKTATLTLAIPGAFSGKVPEALPWDE
jgi:prophage tail gpP-like protein/phage tail protein X